MKTFEKQNMETKFYVIGHKSELYLNDWRFAVECDIKGS